MLKASRRWPLQAMIKATTSEGPAPDNNSSGSNSSSLSMRRFISEKGEQGEVGRWSGEDVM